MSAELPSEVSVTERGERVLDCPSAIGEQLEKAAFVRAGPNVFKKYRDILGEDDKNYQIAKVTVEGNSIRISVTDVIGIVNLTPSSQLRINPKIGWDQIFEMFLTVHRSSRSIEYQGVPIEEFLADDISLEDIFLVVAVNYLQALEPLHRYGFIREFHTQRVDAVEANGRIDVSQSILNHQRGIPKQHYIVKDVEYSTNCHKLIHAAGKQLLQLFENHIDRYDHEGYYHIFSAVQNEVRNLENLGVTSDLKRLSEYSEVSVGDLPRQRDYYHQAIEISKTILSSSTGQSAGAGHEELTIDYILNMETLFEKYTQHLLDDIASGIVEGDLFVDGHEVAVEGKPKLSAYTDHAGVYHQPDHLLKKGESVLAVLDTKYHSDNADPTTQTGSRSRMFSYAYLLDVDEMAFLMPSSPQRERSVAGRDAFVRIISPIKKDTSEEQFTTDGYRDAIRQYLEEILSHQLERHGLFKEIEERGICHDQLTRSTPYSYSELPDNLSMNKLQNRQQKRSILKQAAKESNDVKNHRALSKRSRHELIGKIRNSITDHEKANYCIPIFYDDIDQFLDEREPSDGDEYGEEGLKMYYISGRTGYWEIINTDHIRLES